jgi:hypothetical protein
MVLCAVCACCFAPCVCLCNCLCPCATSKDKDEAPAAAPAEPDADKGAEEPQGAPMATAPSDVVMMNPLAEEPVAGA